MDPNTVDVGPKKLLLSFVYSL